jgi:hypothetical protein
MAPLLGPMYTFNKVLLLFSTRSTSYMLTDFYLMPDTTPYTPPRLTTYGSVTTLTARGCAFGKQIGAPSDFSFSIGGREFALPITDCS